MQCHELISPDVLLNILSVPLKHQLGALCCLRAIHVSAVMEWR